jgi:hypothetical protein
VGLDPFRTDVDAAPGAATEEGFDVELARLDGDDLLAALAHLAEWVPARPAG